MTQEIDDERFSFFPSLFIFSLQSAGRGKKRIQSLIKSLLNVKILRNEYLKPQREDFFVVEPRDVCDGYGNAHDLIKINEYSIWFN